MRKLMYFIGMIFICACGTNPQKEMEKTIVGEWCNPYTYQSTGELKGFNYKKGGVCEAINIPSLELKSWEIKDGYLITKGFDINEDGSKTPYETKERIEKLNADTLVLVAQEANPKLVFVYLNTKVIKNRVSVGD